MLRDNLNNDSEEATKILSRHNNFPSVPEERSGHSATFRFTNINRSLPLFPPCITVQKYQVLVKSSKSKILRNEVKMYKFYT